MREVYRAIPAEWELTDAGETLDEEAEIELASQLLEVTDDRELDQFIGRLIRRAGGAIGQFASSDAGRALGGMLKATARKTLPLIGGALGGYVAGSAGRKGGAQLAAAAGRMFGLELEGLSPEDQEFETARRFVRFGGSAVRRAARTRTWRGRAGLKTARAATLRAARRHAPGLLRQGGGGSPAKAGGAPPSPMPAPDASADPGAASDSVTPADSPSADAAPAAPVGSGGRWFRHGPYSLVINCAPPAQPVESTGTSPEPPAPSGPDESSVNKEATVHDIDRTLTELDSEIDMFETDEFDSGVGELDGELGTDFEAPFDEVEELALANELLSIANEEELDMFLGKLVKRAWRGVRKVAGGLARPLGGVLKGLAKKALPFVGGALGSFIPIPGVGTAVGTALGGALSKALETELEGVAPEERELEMARRFVRVAGTAAQQAVSAPAANRDPVATAKQAVVAAAKQHVPALNGGGAGASAGFPRVRGRSGRWIRRGSKIVVLGV